MVRAAFALAVLFAGCGNSGPVKHSVSGTVKLKNGMPVTRGVVQFSSGKFTGNGGITADGKYTLSGDSEASGIPEGTYKVLILSTTGGLAYESTGGPAHIIDGKYEDIARTPLEVKVPGGKYDFDLDPHVGK